MLTRSRPHASTGREVFQTFNSATGRSYQIAHEIAHDSGVRPARLFAVPGNLSHVDPVGARAVDTHDRRGD